MEFNFVVVDSKDANKMNSDEIRKLIFKIRDVLAPLSFVDGRLHTQALVSINNLQSVLWERRGQGLTGAIGAALRHPTKKKNNDNKGRKSGKHKRN